MLRRLCKWILQDYILEEQMRWWSAGVKQHMHDPESCHPVSWIDGDVWPSYEQYYYGVE